jgi:4-hydroxybenzoate polyprenyltransferase
VTTASQAIAPALCVDLDGTLIRGNLLLESTMLLLKRNPLHALQLPLWQMRGKAALDTEIASRIELDPESLPYNREFLAWLHSEREKGRSIWLCTASNPRLAERVAEHLGLFDGILASDDSTNLARSARAARLTNQFGEGQFDYCGNRRCDLEVWKHASGAIVVEGNRQIEKDAALQTQVLRIFSSKTSKFPAVLRAMRPHQWAKNVLILVPLLAAHRSLSAENLTPALLAVAAFCFCASSVYVINDLLDLTADRVHSRKRTRPFANGDLSIMAGLRLAPALLLLTIVIAAYLSTKFQLVLASYYATTLAYSFVLKERVLLDTLALAGLYTLRVIAGSAAVGIPLSFWLLLFSVFLFLSLAFVKRFAEVDALRRENILRAAGRGYFVDDLSLLQSLGTASGYLSVLVLALYINSPDIASLYRRPKVIWVLCVLMLYWISRVWVKAQRGQMHDDPVVFALKDYVSLGVGLLAAITVALAI